MPDDMPLYQGTKTLRARTMNKRAYCLYRGWEVPANEDPTESGYLVEYQDGGKPNDERHEGYISWSPADVFERTYMPAESFVDRMRIELRELSERKTKLAIFINSTKFASVADADQLLLRNQLSAMEAYLSTLTARLERAASAFADDGA